MQIVETTSIRPSGIKILEQITKQNPQIHTINFKEALFMVEEHYLSVHTPDVILDLGDNELVISNHYHESDYSTGLQYLLFREQEKSNRPYPTKYVDRRFQAVITQIDIYGLNEISHHWDETTISHYKRLGKIPDSVSSVEHLLQFQHIVCCHLNNGTSISIRSDLPRQVVVKLWFNTSDCKAYLSSFHKWQTLIL